MPGELTQLLDYHQAAPIGFLFIEKLSILVFGNHDYIMRLFPLLAGILAKLGAVLEGETAS